MIYTIHTKRGLGVQIWGTYEDLRTFYDIVAKFWNIDEFQEQPGFDNRNELLSDFSYQIRKAMDGNRLSRKGSHFFPNENEYFGFESSWVQVIFSIVALKTNWNLVHVDKLDLSYFNNLEFWIERSLRSYDDKTADLIIPYLNGALYGGNPCIYQFMRRINLDFFLLGGGKAAFKKLPNLMKTASFATVEYKKLNDELIIEAKKIGSKPDLLDFDESNEIYNIVW